MKNPDDNSVLPLRAWGQPTERAEARVRRYPTLGRTGMQVSDVSFGSGRLGAGEGLVRHAR